MPLDFENQYFRPKALGRTTSLDQPFWRGCHHSSSGTGDLSATLKNEQEGCIHALFSSLGKSLVRAEAKYRNRQALSCKSRNNTLRDMTLLSIVRKHAGSMRLKLYKTVIWAHGRKGGRNTATANTQTSCEGFALQIANSTIISSAMQEPQFTSFFSLKINTYIISASYKGFGNPYLIKLTKHVSIGLAQINLSSVFEVQVIWFWSWGNEGFLCVCVTGLYVHVCCFFLFFSFKWVTDNTSSRNNDKYVSQLCFVL